VIIFGIVSIIIFKTLRSYFAKKMTLIFTLCWIGFWITVLVAVFLPGLMDVIANYVGVGRGVDFAVYLSVIVLFYLIYRIYTHLMRIEKQLTDIVRKDAIRNVKE